LAREAHNLTRRVQGEQEPADDQLAEQLPRGLHVLGREPTPIGEHCVDAWAQVRRVRQGFGGAVQCSERGL
jgi:hypothetical protein